MTSAIRLKAPGGVEQLQRVDWPEAVPGQGEIRLRQSAIGVNFIDIYHRTGLYPLPPPSIPGVEGAGVVEAIGPGVTGLSIGDRVAYAGEPGGYAATRLLPAWRAVPLPPAIDPEIAAASLLRGLTVEMLFTRTFPVARGTVVLIQAAAGGLGAILTRRARQIGALVIGTVGSPEKAERARASGADHVIVGRDADVAAEVMRLTGGQGADFAIDGIGGTTLLRTLGAMRRFGVVASIGQAAGPIPPIAVSEIGPMRSLSLARPSVMAYAAERDTYPVAAAAVRGMIEAGIAGDIGARYKLAEAARAQADLEAGRISGSAILLPGDGEAS